jgi:hypothetical protein
MSELELRLQSLGREIAFPETPDLAPAVARGIERPPARRFWSRRALVVGLAALVVAVGAVLAVPPARSAILDFFGIGSAEIRIVDELPEVEVVTLDLGQTSSLEAARKLVPGLLEPHLDGVGKPDAVYVQDLQAGTPVTFVWGDQKHPRLLLTQVRGRFYFEKLVHNQQSGFVLTKVNGENAGWIEGAPHVLYYESGRAGGTLPGRLAGNTLVWSRGPVTLRLEGQLAREDAERIARTVR